MATKAYTVVVARDIIEYAEVQVEATSRAEARTKARRRILEGHVHNTQWTERAEGRVFFVSVRP